MARRTDGEKAAAKTMGGGRKPSERASKICVACGLPFSWRKKWERDWDSVKYCSDRCRMSGKGTGAGAKA